MAHLLMLHGHPVGYLPPTMGSEILYDSNNSVNDKIDEVEQEIITSWVASGAACTDTTLTVALLKVGRIVFGTIRDGSASGDAGDIIAKFPTGYVPNPSIVWDFQDSYSNKRLQISSSGIKAVEAFSGNILRGSFMYYV